MTVKELSKLYWLNREIELNQKQLAALREDYRQAQSRLWELRESMDGGMLESPVISDMPKAPSVGNKVESTVVRAIGLEEALKRKGDAIRDIETLISARQTLCLLERKRLEDYIAGVDDGFLRQVFTLRFINGLPWEQVAESIGGGNKAESVRKACYRYINKRR